MGDVKKAPDQVVKILNIFIIWTGSLFIFIISEYFVSQKTLGLIRFWFSAKERREAMSNFPLWEIL